MSSKQPKAKVLRIGLFQNNRIIEERLLRTPKKVTIGSDFRRNTFVVPASELPASQDVFDVKNGKYVIYITKGMTGRIKIGSEIETLQDLIRKGRAKKSGNGYAFTLPMNAQGRLAFGEATLLFQFVTPPPPRPKPVLPASMRGGWIQSMDPILGISTSVTAILLIGFVIFLETRDWPVQIDRQQVLQDRFVTILADEDPPEPEKPEPEPEDLEEGEGEPEETEGEPEPAPKPDPKPKPKKPAEEDKPPKDDKPSKDPKSPDELARLEAERKRRLAKEVENKTILGQIGSVGEDGSSGNLADVLSEGAGRTSVDDAFEGSTGITAGVAGQEKSGLRSSGSSDAEGVGGTVGGVGFEKGEGAKRASEGVGTGGGKKETKVKANVNIKGPTRAIGGKLDANNISRVLKRKTSAFQKCYERELKKNPKAGGKVVVVFVVGGAGRVTSSKPTTDSVGGGVGQCIANTIKRLRFNSPKGGDATVSKSFVFSSGG